MKKSKIKARNKQQKDWIARLQRNNYFRGNSMNDFQLSSLIGLTVDEAIIMATQNKLKPQVYHEKSIRCSIALAKDVVELNHNDQGIITSVNTQESIDSKYK